MSYSPSAKAIAIAPKFTAVMSIFGSGYIIMHQIRTMRKQGVRKSNTQLRLLVGMSCCDLLVSTCFFFTTWPIPSDEDVYAAVGTPSTCVAQGFFSQFSLATAMYNASLSVYYVVKIKYGWTDDRIQKVVEPFLHGVALLIATSTSMAGLFLNLYNNDSWECWISPKPMDCKESWKNNGETTCERGDNASLYRWVLYYAILWAAILLVTINMIMVYYSVLAKERAIDRYDPTNERRRNLSKRVATQGYWYCGAFYGTWLFPTITRLVQVIAGKTPYPLILVTAMFVPIQGFFNFLVYVHPRFQSLQTNKRGSTSQIGSTFFRRGRNASSVTSQQCGKNNHSVGSASFEKSVGSASFEKTVTVSITQQSVPESAPPTSPPVTVTTTNFEQPVTSPFSGDDKQEGDVQTAAPQQDEHTDVLQQATSNLTMSTANYSSEDGHSDESITQEPSLVQQGTGADIAAEDNTIPEMPPTATTTITAVMGDVPINNIPQVLVSTTPAVDSVDNNSPEAPPAAAAAAAATDEVNKDGLQVAVPATTAVDDDGSNSSEAPPTTTTTTTTEMDEAPDNSPQVVASATTAVDDNGSNGSEAPPTAATATTAAEMDKVPDNSPQVVVSTTTAVDDDGSNSSEAPPTAATAATVAEMEKAQDNSPQVVVSTTAAADDDGSNCSEAPPTAATATTAAEMAEVPDNSPQVVVSTTTAADDDGSNSSETPPATATVTAIDEVPGSSPQVAVSVATAVDDDGSNSSEAPPTSTTAMDEVQINSPQMVSAAAATDDDNNKSPEAPSAAAPIAMGNIHKVGQSAREKMRSLETKLHQSIRHDD